MSAKSNKGLITILTAGVLTVAVVVLAYLVMNANQTPGVAPNGQKLGDNGSPYTDSKTPSLDSRTVKPMGVNNSTMDRDRGLNPAPMQSASQPDNAASGDNNLSTGQNGQDSPRDTSGGTGIIGSGRTSGGGNTDSGSSSSGSSNSSGSSQ